MTRNWHVLGAGAQGLLFYAYAIKAQQPWSVIARDCPSHATLDYCVDGVREPLVLRCVTLAECAIITQVVVCVKSTQLATALTALKPHLSHDALVILALNGVGWLASALAQLPTQTVLLLSSVHGSYRDKAWSVVDSGRMGEIVIGSGRALQSDTARTAAIRIAEYFDHIGLNCRWADDIVQRMWLKAAINSCINPLTALLNCRNGELPSHPIAATVLPPLYDELTALLRTLSIEITAVTLEQTVRRACLLTAHNYSSMQQDFRYRRETELDAIVAPFLQRAEALALPCAHLRRVYEAIDAHEDWSALPTTKGPV